MLHFFCEIDAEWNKRFEKSQEFFFIKKKLIRFERRKQNWNKIWLLWNKTKFVSTVIAEDKYTQLCRKREVWNFCEQKIEIFIRAKTSNSQTYWIFHLKILSSRFCYLFLSIPLLRILHSFAYFTMRDTEFR